MFYRGKLDPVICFKKDFQQYKKIKKALQFQGYGTKLTHSIIAGYYDHPAAIEKPARAFLFPRSYSERRGK
jgi:hypothetical protein